MDPTELIKALPEFSRVAVPIAASIPFTGIVKRMLGPAADEVAEMLRDQVRLYRYGRQMECIAKAERYTRNAGFTPSAIPPKILFPLLEGASLEEDETLHDMWSALLANASLGDGGKVRPSFVRALQDMAPDEGRLLQDIANNEPLLENVREQSSKQSFQTLSDLKLAEARRAKKERALSESLQAKFTPLPSEKLEETSRRFQACLQSLEVARLILVKSYNEGTVWELSDRGILFMEACRPPKAKI